MSLKENPNTQESAFQPPNYTQIPNVIFDEWMPILSPASFKTLLCICRKTFGWHKSSDCISRNQLMKQTGLSKATVKTAIDDLIEKGLVFKICTSGEYGHCPNSYRLNIVKPLFENEEDQNLGGGRSNSDLGVGQNLTEGVGQILTTQKKPSTKESSVCSGAPPASQAPPVSGDCPPSRVVVVDFDGKESELTLESLFQIAVLKRKSWTSEEMVECWKIIAAYKKPIRDVAHFADGTIQKKRKVKYAQRDAEEKKGKKWKTKKVSQELQSGANRPPTSSSVKYADSDTLKRIWGL